MGASKTLYFDFLYKHYWFAFALPFIVAYIVYAVAYISLFSKTNLKTRERLLVQK